MTEFFSPSLLAATTEAADKAVQLGVPGLLANLITLAMLILLQAVLGFDNLLYISLESKRAPEEKRQFVRRLGIGLAVFLRIGLLFLLVNLVGKLTKPFFTFETEQISGSFNFHSLIVLGGGAFIIYTAIKEIFHMTHIEEHNIQHDNKTKTKSAGSVIALIVLMNLVFSFDSILSAMALAQYKVEGADGTIQTEYVLWVMVIAIVVSGILMIWLADKVSDFLQKNRMYEVLGLFVLFVVGIMLVSEGGHLAHLKLFGHEVMPMTKATFYFVIFVLAVTDIVQGRYQKKLLAERDRQVAKTNAEKVS